MADLLKFNEATEKVYIGDEEYDIAPFSPAKVKEFEEYIEDYAERDLEGVGDIFDYYEGLVKILLVGGDMSKVTMDVLDGRTVERIRNFFLPESMREMQKLIGF